MIYTFLLVWSVASLGGFHAYLIVRGRSTHEEFLERDNHFSEGGLGNCATIWCPTSLPSFQSPAQKKDGLSCV